jgi:hypothetical protein
MAFKIINVEGEIRNFLKGRKTNEDLGFLLECAGPSYLAAVAKAKARKPKDVAELERLFTLEDPRP